ncbi:(Na+)-NQR maturation NqrM [Aggregatibacter actinomycetemcomitans]|uniref:(Na+)-NQR maturation NqrM n=1 Tax=Aggregatibacter actinomycetemcomitans TaxID=714 RepID=UPI0011DCBCDE|nr:(Na+)-NQR maturation NqrM [Aggregatibacter actinomycetemcomitans]QEH44700.1 (Na+)-NQR maturation NqrM [Aggregatibacter actinomycetemcomitans]QEH48768.1 (Na+)-NQR maturation NqrM [Aggregatibacter actinomycetemcomitans]
MKLFLLTLGIFLLIILAMALGYIVKRQALKGSCGGLSSLGIAKACDCEKPCDTLQSKLDAGDEQAKVEYEQKFTNNVQMQFYEVK